MWLLIECDDLMDAGKNEKQRIIVREKIINVKEDGLGWVVFSGKGQYFHPMTIEKDKVLSKCCDAIIHIGRFQSWCEECGKSVNPDDGVPYLVGGDVRTPQH